VSADRNFHLPTTDETDFQTVKALKGDQGDSLTHQKPMKLMQQ